MSQACVMGPTMKTIGVDAKDVLISSRENKFRRWGGRVGGRIVPNEAAGRIKATGVIEINHEPRFNLPRDCSVFTIGSCFARNIEKKLSASGIDVPTTRFALPKGVYSKVDSDGLANSVLNKFTIHSISNELDRVLEGRKIENRGFIEETDGLWRDPQATHSTPMSWEDVNRLRDAIEATTISIRTADATFITLGLTESWLDTKTGVYLNGSLPARDMRRHPNRFRFVNPSYAELRLEMHRIIETIKRYGKPDAKIIVTVSPVPLDKTFSGQDVIVANSYSKSVLRAVAEDVRFLDGVDYFPSYEMAMFSPRDSTWQDDQRHVSQAAIEAITGRFVALYIK